MVEWAGRFQRGHCTRLTVLDGDLEQRSWDIRRDIEIAVCPERDAVEADAVLCRCQHRIRCPDLQRGATRLEAIHIWRERVGDVSRPIAADGDVVAQRFRILERSTALQRAAGEI